VTEREEFPKEVIKMVEALIESRYDEIFDDKNELERFRKFIRQRGIPHQSYVIAVPLEEGGSAFFRYQIVEQNVVKNMLMVGAGIPQVFMNDEGSEQLIPEPCQGLPIWWLDGGRED